jgi:hypothetical protein
MVSEPKHISILGSFLWLISGSSVNSVHVGVMNEPALLTRTTEKKTGRLPSQNGQLVSSGA